MKITSWRVLYRPLTRCYSRALHGSLKGYMGIVTSMMAELTNETNAARGFSMLPMSFSLGYAIGSVTPSDSRHRSLAEI
jgi:hypothetical protein